jgi:hypothetical protein
MSRRLIGSSFAKEGIHVPELEVLGVPTSDDNETETLSRV